MITIAYLYPDLLNMYGDRGNIASLSYRMKKRGIECEIKEYSIGDVIDFKNTHIIYLGGGSEKEQKNVCAELMKYRNELSEYVEDGGVMLAVCSGFEILGKSYEIRNEEFEGLGVLDIYGKWNDKRFIGDVIIDCPLAGTTVVGFENHNMRIKTGNVSSFGKILYGNGNDGETFVEGAFYKNLVATFLHGPLLPKNPELSDWFISKALERQGISTALEPLDDSDEIAAREYIVNKFLTKNK